LKKKGEIEKEGTEGGKKKEEKKKGVVEKGLGFIRRFDYFGRPINLNHKGEE